MARCYEEPLPVGMDPDWQSSNVTIRSAIVGVTLAALIVTVAGSAGLAASPTPSEPSASPAASGAFDPADFTTVVDNPWFPLVPGKTLTYEGSSDGGRSKDIFEVTNETDTIDGVPVVAIHDTVYEEGKVVEDTIDWYTQDLDGNVWYFGEDTRTFDAKGDVESTEGSWRSGVDGALAGIFMPADPTIGQAFQQEILSGPRGGLVRHPAHGPGQGGEGAVWLIPRCDGHSGVDPTRTRGPIREGLRGGGRPDQGD